MTLKNDVNVLQKEKKEKKLIFVDILKATDERAESGSVTQWYGSADLDPY
jgi:hypothetical protein